MATLARGDRLCGRYALLGKIGSGGHAEVWRAQDAETRTDVALKILRPEHAASNEAWAVLEHEYAVTSQLAHPGILRVYAPQRCDGQSILPMDFAPGGDLSRLRGEPYTVVLPALIEVAQALEHAHARGVVHRDLKPGNVVLDKAGHAQLVDFGVASLGGASPFSDHGSPFSASPQALRGNPPAPSDDIYGLGTLAYELLSGYPPFYPRFEPQRVLSEPIPELAAVHSAPPRLLVLVMRMLAKQPHSRPGSMREVIAELHAALTDTPTFEQRSLMETAALPIATQRELPPLRESLPLHEPPLREPLHAREPAQAREPLRSFDSAAAASHAPLSASRERVDRFTLDAPMHAHAPPPSARGFDDITVAVPPSVTAERESRKRSRSVASALSWIATGIAAVALVGAFAWLPTLAPRVLPAPAPVVAAVEPAPARAPAPELIPRVAEAREAAEQRLAALEARGAAVWAAGAFAGARALMEEAAAAQADDRLADALDRYRTANDAITTLEAQAPAALEAQLAAGETALAAGQVAEARQAFALAMQIDATNARAVEGTRRTEALDTGLPLLAEAANAATAGDHAGAIERYDRVLAADADNAVARDGRARSVAAMAEDAYARTLARGFEGLRAGNLDEARAAFEQARALRPDAPEPGAGLQQVAAASVARIGRAAQAEAASYEADERWIEALAVYDEVLQREPSLEFARRGFERVAPRAELHRGLQRLIDRPDRLASAEVRDEAMRLLERAEAVQPAGPVLRSQLARVQIALAEYQREVRISLQSDNLTQVSIQRVGSLGSFLRRDIELKPGRYTVLGTREGFRDFRREINITPGTETQIVQVSCVEPI